ncbi:hypothetical protein [Bacillus salacetis]|nr:hypothetical protein [Bacillus salacetis]
MYAVIALFDEKTDTLVRNIWQGLREKEISFYAEEVIDRIPHITLAG